jgi:uracil phosphoribosyltransferase
MKEHYLEILRKNSSSLLEFRTAAHGLAKLLFADASTRLAHRRVIVVPILRAGLAFLNAALEFFPNAPVGFFGIRRDEKTALPHLYYENLPKISPQDWILLLDPMLATGGSALLALEKLKAAGAVLDQTMLISAISSMPGVDALERRFPQVGHFSAALDLSLNAKKMIVPGLGDFGDRFFGTMC